MKKIITSFLIASVLLTSAGAKAIDNNWTAWSKSETPTRITVDAENYSTDVKDIKFQVEKKGNDKVYYTAWLRKRTTDFAMKALKVEGSFTHMTEEHSFPVGSTRKDWGTGFYDVYVVIYSDYNRENVIGLSISKTFYIVSDI